MAPPVPSLLVAVMAAAGMVRVLWDLTPARTVAMFVVLRTEVLLTAKRESRTRQEWDFRIATSREKRPK